jgi:hypothetical protein
MHRDQCCPLMSNLYILQRESKRSEPRIASAQKTQTHEIWPRALLPSAQNVCLLLPDSQRLRVVEEAVSGHHVSTPDHGLGKRRTDKLGGVSRVRIDLVPWITTNDPRSLLQHHPASSTATLDLIGINELPRCHSATPAHQEKTKQKLTLTS